MGKPTLFDNLREWWAGVTFAIYLRAIRMTKEEFWAEQDRQAVEQMRAADCPDCGGELQLLVRCIKCHHTQSVSR